MPAFKLPNQDAMDPGLQGLLNKAALAPEPNEPEKVDITNIGIPVNQINSYQRLLSWYGIPTELEGRNFIGHCPFNDCPELYGDKEPKFSMSIQTGEYRCFRCGAKGNRFSFVWEIHKHYFKSTTDDDLDRLCSERKRAFGIGIAREMQIAWNSSTKEWMLPAWGENGSADGPSNLYVWRVQYDVLTAAPYKPLLASPMSSQLPYGLNRLRSGTQRPIWILEGHWDYLAFNQLLINLKKQADYDTLAVPGAGTFPRKYLNVLNGRDIIIAFDNDTPGQQGIQTLMQSMHSNSIMPTKCRVLQWPPGMPDGFDVSDVVTSLPKKIKKAVKVV